MSVKTTLKLGDEVHNFDEHDQFYHTPENLRQLETFKIGMGIMVQSIELQNPKMKNKRIEVIIEFEDDGFYVVIGRKPKEVEGFGT